MYQHHHSQWHKSRLLSGVLLTLVYLSIIQKENKQIDK